MFALKNGHVPPKRAISRTGSCLGDFWGCFDEVVEQMIRHLNTSVVLNRIGYLNRPKQTGKWVWEPVSAYRMSCVGYQKIGIEHHEIDLIP